MPTTPKGLRYPSATDSPNIALYFQNLANDANAALPGNWVPAYTGDTSYTFSPSAANAWETLPGMSVTTTVVPAGRNLEVDFKAPICNPADGFLYLRLMIAGAQKDTSGFSAGWGPGRLSADHTGAGATVAISVQAQRSADGGVVLAAGGGAPRLRYRII